MTTRLERAEINYISRGFPEHKGHLQGKIYVTDVMAEFAAAECSALDKENAELRQALGDVVAAIDVGRGLLDALARAEAVLTETKVI